MQPVILIVEDIQMNAMLMNLALQEIEATVLPARTGTEALALFEQHPEIDLVLMDLHLPDMSGLTVTDRIRAHPRYKSRPVPIIAITANALMEDKAKLLKETGLADYLTKPLNKEKLLASVRACLQKSARHRAAS